MDNLLIVDFDGTLTRIQTANDFIFHCIKKNPIKILIFFLIYIMERLLKLSPFKKAIKFSKESYLFLIKGYSSLYLNKISKEYSRKVISNFMHQNVLNFVMKQRKKSKIILISGAYNIYFEKVCDYFDFDEFYSSDFIFSKGLFSGKINRTFYSEDKVKFLNENGFFKKFSSITILTDSISDLPLIQSANKTFFVTKRDIDPLFIKHYNIVKFNPDFILNEVENE